MRLSETIEHTFEVVSHVEILTPRGARVVGQNLMAGNSLVTENVFPFRPLLFTPKFGIVPNRADSVGASNSEDNPNA